jgi:hypothetical protein
VLSMVNRKRSGLGWMLTRSRLPNMSAFLMHSSPVRQQSDVTPTGVAAQKPTVSALEMLLNFDSSHLLVELVDL